MQRLNKGEEGQSTVGHSLTWMLEEPKKKVNTAEVSRGGRQVD